MSLLNYKRLNRMKLAPTTKRIIKQNQVCPCRHNSVWKWFLFVRNGRLGRKTKISFHLFYLGLETLYDQLQRGDINSPSVYQTLGPRQASSELTDNEGYYTSSESFSKHFLNVLSSFYAYNETVEN